MDSEFSKYKENEENKENQRKLLGGHFCPEVCTPCFSPQFREIMFWWENARAYQNLSNFPSSTKKLLLLFFPYFYFLYFSSPYF